MNKTLIVGGAVIVILILGVVLLFRDNPPPADTETPVATAPAPRVVPKKTEPDVSRAEVPRKETPVKKSEPGRSEPAAPAAPTLASLTLESDVPGASVFIDRQYVGTTPLTLAKLEPGSKRVQLTATGYDSIQRTIELVPGPNVVSMRIKEITLNARTPVVHKHGMGSCEGTLVATLDGLRYETSNRNDAFTLPYARVETFAVDYLEKNLRVKQRGGRTWNFTDKNDNADPLFVFHRDVEAARKKLADGYVPGQ